MTEGVLELPSLGRPMQLGMLYDCRSDNLIAGLTLWDPATLQNDRDVRPQPGTQFDIISSDGIDDKASALDVDASLKASFLGGLVEVHGSAKFLNDVKSSQHQSRLTLHYKTTTIFEQLTMKQLGRDNVQHPDVFDQGTATHVITGILYGAQAFFVFDSDCTSEENVKDVEGNVHGILKKSVSVEMDGSGSLNVSERERVDKIRCKFHGDFTLDNNPSNYEEAISVYKKLPSMLGSNGENAVPMRVWLYPLDKLDHKAAKLVRHISVNLISQSQGILEGLEHIQVKCNDMTTLDLCTDFPQFPDKFSMLKKLLLDYKLSFQQYLAKALPAIRGGGVEEQTLANTLCDSVKSPFNLQQLSDWVASKQKEMNVVKAYMKLFAGIQIIRSRANLDELVLDPLVEYVICFSFPIDGGEEYLTILSQYLKSPHPHLNPVSSGWFDEKSTSMNIRTRARNFAEFYRANMDAGNTAFAVTGFDDKTQSVASGLILLFEEGVLTTKGFEPPGRPGKPSVTSKSHDEICLEWQSPKCGLAEVKYYQVKYRGAKPGPRPCFSGWLETRTSSGERNLTIRGLQPFTSYEFQVVAVCRAGVSNVSDTSDTCTTLPASAPTEVRKHGASESSMTIVWDQPVLLGEGVRIERYVIKYRQLDGPSIANPRQADSKTTSDPSCLYTIDDVQADSKYKIRVSAVCGKSGNSTESEPIEVATDSIHKPARYAEDITRDAEILKQGCELKGEPTILQIPLIQESVVSGGKYLSYSFGKRSVTRPMCHHKVIMVVGATGAGKSTLINGVINYILRVDWKDWFRFKVVNERDSKSQAHSQTQAITLYTIYRNKHHNIPYTLTVIDTPGFGDTRGIERDRAIIAQIREFFTHSEAQRVDHIDAIGFVAQSSQARLTHTQRYVFDSILSVFGKDISPNILLLVTFCDGQKPPVIDAVKEADIPCSKSMFKFNNSALFANNKSLDNIADDEENAENFDKMFWKMGTKSMWNFFKALDQLEPRSLTLTKEVLEERNRLEVAVEGLQPQIQMGVCTLEELRNEQQILQQHEAEIKANESFEYEVEVPRSRMIPITGKYITNCSKCHFTCHYPCGIPNDDNKRNCSAMNSAQGICNVCPGKCIWNVHFNQAYKFEYYTEMETRTYAELEERYKDATGKKLTVEQVINKHYDEFINVQRAVIELITTSHRSLKRLEEIALKPNPLSTVEYVDLLIESEKSEVKPGWKSRVKALQDVRKQADIMGKVKQANYDPFANYKKDVLSKKGGKPGKPWYKFW